MSTEADGMRLPLALQIFLACALMVALAITCSAALTRFIGHPASPPMRCARRWTRPPTRSSASAGSA